jgi:hypothetical protein
MNPPVCADTLVATRASAPAMNESLQRRVPRDTKSLLTVRQTGIDTALAAKFTWSWERNRCCP